MEDAGQDAVGAVDPGLRPTPVALRVVGLTLRHLSGMGEGVETGLGCSQVVPGFTGPLLQPLRTPLEGLALADPLP